VPAMLAERLLVYPEHGADLRLRRPVGDHGRDIGSIFALWVPYVLAADL
jgi:hypothetical protein